MSKPVIRKFVFLFISLSMPLYSYASGGWVGNSPMEVASAPTTIYQPSYSSSPEAPEERWNSLLLPDDKSRFSVSLGGQHHNQDEASYSNFFLNLGYDHAFSVNWTTFSFTTWGYSLLAGSGKGSELALFFGLLDGFDYSNFSGLLVGPGVGVGYSYSTDRWRFLSRLSATGMYSFHREQLENSKLRLNADIQYFISENWAVGLQSGVRYYTYLEDSDVGNCATHGCYQVSGRLFAENTMAYLTRKISKEAEISLGVGDRQNARVDYSINW
jgi:hypothetical protein